VIVQTHRLFAAALCVLAFIFAVLTTAQAEAPPSWMLSEVPVLGTFFAKDANGKFESEEEAHLLEAGPLTELWAISNTAEHVASAAGSLKLSLIGGNLGKPWSGLGA
jgi:hypothetical protein